MLLTANFDKFEKLCCDNFFKTINNLFQWLKLPMFSSSQIEIASRNKKYWNYLHSARNLQKNIAKFSLVFSNFFCFDFEGKCPCVTYSVETRNLVVTDDLRFELSTCSKQPMTSYTNYISFPLCICSALKIMWCKYLGMCVDRNAYLAFSPYDYPSQGMSRIFKCHWSNLFRLQNN